MEFINNINSGKYNLIFYSMIIFVLFNLYFKKNITEHAENTTSDESVIKEKIKEIYLADVEAIRNLGEIAKQLNTNNNVKLLGSLEIANKLTFKEPNDFITYETTNNQLAINTANKGTIKSDNQDIIKWSKDEVEITKPLKINGRTLDQYISGGGSTSNTLKIGNTEITEDLLKILLASAFRSNPSLLNKTTNTELAQTVVVAGYTTEPISEQHYKMEGPTKIYAFDGIQYFIILDRPINFASKEIIILQGWIIEFNNRSFFLYNGTSSIKKYIIPQDKALATNVVSYQARWIGFLDPTDTEIRTNL